MRLKDLKLEDFVNYKLPSMFIGACHCDWKCCKEQNLNENLCQNSELSKLKTRNISDSILFDLYITNEITRAVVIGGLEPMCQYMEIVELIRCFRDNGVECPFVIYTGYYPHEIPYQLEQLKPYENIIVKYGRFIPNDKSRYDEVLGVTLASSNQYAEVLS